MGGGAIPLEWHEIKNPESEYRFTLQQLYDSGFDKLSVGDTIYFFISRISWDNNTTQCSVYGMCMAELTSTGYNTARGIGYTALVSSVYGQETEVETGTSSAGGKTPSDAYYAVNMSARSNYKWYYALPIKS